MNFANYIGTPWVAGSQGPDAYDCMGFFRHIQRKHFNIEVPQIIAPDYNNPRVLVDLFSSHPERQRWSSLQKPVHGSAVIVRHPLHIGTWLDMDGGGVIHCVRGIGVIFTHDSSWPSSGFGQKDYFGIST
jgi:hypothetical protein